VAVLPFADARGDLVTVHNIRNLSYRTGADFDVRYYDKTFDFINSNARIIGNDPEYSRKIREWLLTPPLRR
jgi:hypothetical protein